MARRKKMVSSRKLLSPGALLGEESRASVAVTVAWMLTILATGLALMGAAIVFVIADRAALAPESRRIVSLLSRLNLVIAVVTSPLCLVLTMLVYRVRRDPPPMAITVTAVILGVLPLALLVLLL